MVASQGPQLLPAFTRETTVSSHLERIAHGAQHHAEQRAEKGVAELVGHRRGYRADEAHNLVAELHLGVDDGLNPGNHLRENQEA